MSYEYADQAGHKISVLVGPGAPAVYIEVGAKSDGCALLVQPEYAPALALAILEAAGLRDSGDSILESAVDAVKAAVLHNKLIAHEQAEREAEDAKVAAFHTAIGANLDRIQRHHRDLYRAAREFFKEQS